MVFMIEVTFVIQIIIYMSPVVAPSKGPFDHAMLPRNAAGEHHGHSVTAGGCRESLARVLAQRIHTYKTL